MWRGVKSDQVVRHLKPGVLHRVAGYVLGTHLSLLCSKWSSLDYGTSTSIVKYSAVVFFLKPSSGFLMSAEPDFFPKCLLRYLAPQIILLIFFSDFVDPTRVYS